MNWKRIGWVVLGVVVVALILAYVVFAIGFLTLVIDALTKYVNS